MKTCPPPIADQAIDFVLSKINRSVGTRAEGPQAPVRYELPEEVVAEAIINAMAHRDYASSAAIQVSLFADRLEIANPGELLPPLTLELLRRPHRSIARNHRICEALFLARYIEKFGTGTLMMIKETGANGLAEPQFEQSPGEFVITLWRDWLTAKTISQLDLNERQRQVLLHLKTVGKITNAEYQRLTSAIKKTASRDLEGLRRKGVLNKIGTTGRGTFYVLARHGDIKGTKGTPNPSRSKGT